jgi:hypothetical protein
MIKTSRELVFEKRSLKTAQIYKLRLEILRRFRCLKCCLDFLLKPFESVILTVAGETLHDALTSFIMNRSPHPS